MSDQSRCYVVQFRLDINIRIPQSLSNHTRFLHDLLLKGIFIADLVPHAGCTTYDVYVFDAGLETVGLSPVLERTVVASVETTEADVQISHVVVRKDDLVLAADQSIDIGADTPPVDHIIVLDG